MCFSESISHTAAEDQLIYFAQQVLDDTDLRAYFRTAHDSHERTFDIFEDSVNSSYLFLHQESEHLVVCVEIIGDDSSRSMLAVSRTESVHHVAVCVRSERLSELFLTCFHLFLGGLVCGILFLDTYRFAFLLRIEAEVLEQQYLARFESGSLCLCFRAVLCELNRTT